MAVNDNETLDGKTPSYRLANTSVDYTDNHVTSNLHPAFAEDEVEYNDGCDKFLLKESDTLGDETILQDSQQAFSQILRQYEENADPKLKTGIDLSATHTWNEVIEKVDLARNSYSGTGGDNNVSSIRKGFRNFYVAAPAIELWLKLLPSASIYGSILCGGITMILEAAMKIGRLREDSFEALDQIPLRVARAQSFMRIYAGTGMSKQAAELYSAIIDALYHIFAWYNRKAGIKLFASFAKGSVYASTLRMKMKNVQDASEAMEHQAELNQHLRLQGISHVTWQTKTQLSRVESEMKDLALEARNHLYKVFRDTEAWQEAIQSWVVSQQANDRPYVSHSRRDDGGPIDLETLLQSLKYDPHELSSDVKEALQQIFSFPLAEQDKAVAIIQHPQVEEWILQPSFGAILVHANARRHESISPASIASAMIVHVFSKTCLRASVPIVTLYWFCGAHINGPDDNMRGLLRSYVCQILRTGLLDHDFRQPQNFDGIDLDSLFDTFTKCLSLLPTKVAVIGIIDGISWYEDSRLCEDTCEVIRKLVRLTREDTHIFKLFMTSPTRTTRIHQDPRINKHMTVLEIPRHVDGAKQGFNHRAIITSTKQKVRELSKDLSGRRRS